MIEAILLARKFIQYSLLFVCVATTSCSIQNDTKKNELVIFAASSLTNVFEDLANEFESKHPDTNIALSFGSSSQLAAQILEGVSGDIFASANEFQMDLIQNAGEIFELPAIFATNNLIIVVPFENPLNIQELKDLTQPNIRLVLAVPKTPIREYSDQVIKNNLSNTEQLKLYKNLASEEANVRQVVTKIALGEADAGIVYSSDITPQNSALLLGIPIPFQQNITAQYPIAILKSNHNQKLAEDFMDFVLSENGQLIIKKWGFGEKP
jgi:molybdate transport system substrate-binding protein